MSISSPTSAAYYSGYEVDKVVRVYEGTYASADLITRSGFSTAYVYRFAHDLDRPMMCDIIQSTDGGTTWDSGVGSFAFCDSTYVYIFSGFSASISDTMYKIYGTWIDDYDATNPTIDTVSYTSEPTQFDSRLNYQKVERYGELSFDPGTFGSTQTRTITHNLGYTPNVKVFFEAFSGEVWPLNIGGARNPVLYDSAQDECAAEIYSTYIDVTMYRYSNATRRAWYRVYYDAN